jgi:hypothetical protein
MATQTERIEHCLAKARECELLAEYARDRLIKYDYSEMADQWRRMAKQIKQLAEQLQRASKE